VSGDSNARGQATAGAKDDEANETLSRGTTAPGPDDLAEGVRLKRPFGAIPRDLWQRSDFKGMSFEARALYCYLRTCPEGGLTGIFRLYPEDVEGELGLAVKALSFALDELDGEGFIIRDVALPRWVWIPGAFADAPGIFAANPNHRRAAEKWLLRVPPSWAKAFRETHFKPFLDPIPEPFPDPIQEPSPEGIDEQEIRDTQHATPDTRNAERTDRKEERTLDVSDCPKCGRDSCEGCESVETADRLALLQRQAAEITAAGR
jgi:hypothetical protein